VRDLATTHVRALNVPEAEDMRFNIYSGDTRSQAIAEEFRKDVPALQARVVIGSSGKQKAGGGGSGRQQGRDDPRHVVADQSGDDCQHGKAIQTANMGKQFMAACKLGADVVSHSKIWAIAAEVAIDPQLCGFPQHVYTMPA
jgi:hypothetical protein